MDNLFKLKAACQAIPYRDNLFVTRYKRKLYEDIADKRKLYEHIVEGQVIDVRYTIGFSGLGYPGRNTQTVRGAFVGEDGSNVILVTAKDAKAYIPIICIDSIQ